MLIRDHALDMHVAGAEDTAIVMLRRALSQNDTDHRARTVLAGALLFRGRHEEAKLLLDRALRDDKLDSHAWNLLGLYYTIAGNPERAVSAYKAAVAIQPLNAPCRLDYATALLGAGDYKEGFAQYEGRTGLKAPRHYDIPVWDGTATKNLYVWAEQGAGDTIAFARFLVQAAARCERLTFSTFSSLYPLLAGYDAISNVTVIDNPSIPADCDCHVSLMSLPRLLGTTLQDLPPDPGLLSFPQLGNGGGIPKDGRKKIGICWAGVASHPRQKQRSMPFTTMLRLAEDHSVDLFSFQVGPAAADIASARAQRLVTDLSQFIDGEWAMTAAWLREVDALVTVDTGVAHLAGALGVPVYICVYATPYWMWGADGYPCAWYPSARLVRQKRLFEWDSVIGQIGLALSDRNKIGDRQGTLPL